jgi:hypothetical protein
VLDLAVDFGFADDSPYLSTQVRDPDYEHLMDYREWMFDWYYSYKESIYDGLESYPSFEFGTLVERRNWSSIWPLQRDCITSSTRPLKTGNRFAREEDRQRAGERSWVMPVAYGHS